jgi:Arc/MetJ-type ribon-helix-helix transcriptional regulator
MPRLTVTIDDDQNELLEAVAGEDGEYESKSAAVRDFIQAGEERQELEAEIRRLRDRLESRNERIDELESQLRKRSNIEDKIEDLPDKIRDADSYSERRLQKLDEASLSQRIVWKLTGVPVDDDD